MLTSSDPNRMLSTADAADLLGLQPCTLSAWREDGSQPGLAFFKLGKAVRYRYGDLIAFLETRRASSTLVARQLPQAPAIAAPSGASVKSASRPRKARNAAGTTERQQSLF
jgi:Helix-turn-helix domain